MITPEEYRAYTSGVMTEDELLSVVIGTARTGGWLVHHTRNSRRGVTQGDVGLPDVIAVRSPRLVVAELKKKDGRVTRAQQEWLDRFAQSGAEAYVWRPADWADGTIERILLGIGGTA